MSIITPTNALRNAANSVCLDAREMIAVPGRSDVLRLDFRTHSELLTEERKSLVQIYNKKDFVEIAQKERERGAEIEFDNHLEFLCTFGPLSPEPNKMLVAIVLKDLTDRVSTPSKAQVDKVAHDQTTAQKQLEIYPTAKRPRTPQQSQKTEKSTGKEHIVVSPELEKISETQPPRVGDILKAYGGDCINTKPGGLVVVLMRYNVKKLVRNAEDQSRTEEV